MTFSATVRVGWDRACPRRVVWLLALGLLAACDERVDFMPGDECELNTDCATPLVCRLGRCRVECRAQRDCAAGLECVRDELGLGACQLPDETECTLASDCPQSLVCHFGRCANECESDRDCPPGAHCREDEGVRGCRDESMMECTLTSECEPDLICAVDHRCRVPCRTNWDCSDQRVCLTAGPTPVCGWPSAEDAGVDPDGGDDAGLDGGVGDAGSDGGGVMTPAPQPTLTGGLQNTCAAPAGEAPRCWGGNASGQIGDGTTTPRPSPTAIDGLSSAAILELGHDHACARSGSGVVCWGSNADGQLGLGFAGAGVDTPNAVVGLPAGTVQDLALGSTHTCAIVSGALYCWGDGGDGQLGLGDEEPRLSPTEVPLAAPAIDVDAYSGHTCVVLTDGRLQCFGANGNGQLGNGDTLEVRSPVFVAGLADVVDVAAGGAHTCALDRAGDVWCWGSDTLGEAGDGGAIGAPNVLTPVRAGPFAERILQISAGSAHTCARGAAGVYCWGNNLAGQAGQDKTRDTAIFTPRAIAGIGPVEEIAAGSNHTCVRVSGHLHYCFGSNSDGQLGTGATGGPSWTPVEVAWP